MAIPCPDQHFDLVVSFETLEHHDQHQAMVQEIRRVLRPDGVLLISSPDKHHYSDVPGYANPFHVNELYEHEFAQLLKSSFRHVAMYSQKFCSGSLVTARQPVGQLRGFQSVVGNAQGVVTRNTLSSPVYLIALASQAALPTLDTSFWELAPEVPALAGASTEAAIENAPHLPAFGHYRLGEDIDFRLGGNALLFQRGGWDMANAGGCWTVKADAVLQLQLLGLRSESTSLTIELEAQGIMQAVNQDTFMSLDVNQHRVGDAAFGTKHLHRWTFAVDARVMQDAALTLCLHTFNPAAPSALFLSEDARELGLSVQRLRITQK